MTSWIEPPPRQKGIGCFGKGCLFLFIFLVLLVAAFVVGSYVGVRYVVTSSNPRELPSVQTSESVQQVVRAHWDEFQRASQNHQPSRIDLSADDINQLIAANRRLRGKVYVSIENNVVRAQVSVPLEKLGFRGRYLNGDFSLRPSADRNPRNLQVTQISLSGVDVPERVLKTLLGARSLGSYVDEYSEEYEVTAFAIEDNKIIIETNGGGGAS